jgi:hypothetical protein
MVGVTGQGGLELPSAGCVVYIPEVYPPSETTTYTLKPDYSSLIAGEATVHYFYFIPDGQNSPPTFYSSIGGAMTFIVHDGKLTVSIEEIEVEKIGGTEKLILSANFTCQ